MDEKKVKGTFFVEYVRMIKSNKDKDWDRYLKPEDWEFIDGHVMPSFWYPFEVYQRFGVAIFELIAGGKLEVARVWGQLSAQQQIETVYQGLKNSPDPIKAVERFIILRKQFFNFDLFTLELEILDDKHIKIRVFNLDPQMEGIEPLSHQMLGFFEKLIELTGGNNSRVTFEKMIWKGDPETVVDAVWD